MPPKFAWDSLLKQEGDDLEIHYRHVLEELGKQKGMLGEIFKKARPDIQNPATLRLTLKTNPLKRSDLDEFVECYRPGKRHLRKPAWSESNPEGRWRAFEYQEVVKRDKVNLDIFWLKDTSLEDSEDLPDPDVLAQEIADDLQTALEQFQAIAEKLKG